MKAPELEVANEVPEDSVQLELDVVKAPKLDIPNELVVELAALVVELTAPEGLTPVLIAAFDELLV